MYFFDSDEGSEEWVPDSNDFIAAMGNCFDLEKLM